MFKEWFKKENNKEIVYKTLGLMLVVLFGYLLINFNLIITGLNKVVSLLIPFIYGFCIAYLINPLMCTIEKLVKRVKILNKHSRVIALVLSYLLVFLLITLFLLLVIPQVVVSITLLIQELPTAVDKTSLWITQEVDNTFIANVIKDESQKALVQEKITDLMKSLLGLLSSLLPKMLSLTMVITSGIFKIVIGFIVSLYMLSRKDVFRGQIKKTLLAFLKEQNAKAVTDLAQKVNDKVSKFLIATLLDACIIGVITYIALLILGIHNALLIALIIGVTNMIPFFGPYIGAIPSSLLILLDNPIQVIIFLVFVIILQQIDGNIIAPKLIGDSTGLSAFWVIFAVLVMTGLFGFIGTVLGVPIFAVVYMLMQTKIRKKLRDQGKSDKTEDYI